ncbi:MAG: hypothetical protein JJV98_04400 [Desulfosarcina sp.]|nr:hypothetical protein [Desulfobacterales bacterium]
MMYVDHEAVQVDRDRFDLASSETAAERVRAAADIDMEIIPECSLSHLYNPPVYLFANTLKFFHRPSSRQLIHCNE